MLRYWLRLDDMGYEISADDMSYMGYTEVTKKPEPHSEIYIWDINTWDWAIDLSKAKASIKQVQLQKETAGVTLNDQTFGGNDREKLLLIMFASKAVRDTEHTFYLETVEGVRVQLTSTEIITLHDKVIDHTEFCFNRAAELEQALDAGTLTPEMIDEGWSAPVVVPEEETPAE